MQHILETIMTEEPAVSLLTVTEGIHLLKGLEELGIRHEKLLETIANKWVPKMVENNELQTQFPPEYELKCDEISTERFLAVAGAFAGLSFTTETLQEQLRKMTVDQGMWIKSTDRFSLALSLFSLKVPPSDPGMLLMYKLGKTSHKADALGFDDEHCARILNVLLRQYSEERPDQRMGVEQHGFCEWVDKNLPFLPLKKQQNSAEAPPVPKQIADALTKEGLHPLDQFPCYPYQIDVAVLLDERKEALAQALPKAETYLELKKYLDSETAEGKKRDTNKPLGLALFLVDKLNDVYGGCLKHKMVDTFPAEEAEKFEMQGKSGINERQMLKEQRKRMKYGRWRKPLKEVNGIEDLRDFEDFSGVGKSGGDGEGASSSSSSSSDITPTTDTTTTTSHLLLHETYPKDINLKAVSFSNEMPVLKVRMREEILQKQGWIVAYVEKDMWEHASPADRQMFAAEIAEGCRMEA